LIEKQITTPDQYPLSLNALVNACNQKSNREPLMHLDEPTVKFVVDSLARRHMVVEKSGFGSRVPKYQQIFCNTEFGSLKFTPVETGIVCELLLRGPQTPGELRSRVPRMAELPDPALIDSALNALASRAEGPIVQQLARAPGRRDAAWAQLFEELPEGASAATDDPAASPAAATPAARAAARTAPDGELAARITALETQVAELRAELEALKQASG
jgi:uncharacterized protein YceH (UPF0502 family)